MSTLLLRLETQNGFRTSVRPYVRVTKSQKVFIAFCRYRIPNIVSTWGASCNNFCDAWTHSSLIIHEKDNRNDKIWCNSANRCDYNSWKRILMLISDFWFFFENFQFWVWVRGSKLVPEPQKSKTVKNGRKNLKKSPKILKIYIIL